MILSKGAVAKIVAVSAGFLLFGAALLATAFFIGKGGQSPTPTLTAGIIFICAAALNVPAGIYSEGKVKPISRGNRLVRKDLDPDGFIAYFNALSSGSNAVFRPGYDVYELLYDAYALTGNLRRSRAQLALMKSSLKPKYLPRIAVLEACAAFEDGDVETGERLLAEAEEKAPASFTVRSMADMARKGAGAFAAGDFAAAEKYYNGVLNGAGLMKAENDALLDAHAKLFRICEAEGKTAEAFRHLRWCAENGGRTALAAKAASLLK